MLAAPDTRAQCAGPQADSAACAGLAEAARAFLSRQSESVRDALIALALPEVITADFVYYRLRKPDYTEADVDAFARRAKELLATGKDLYLMFKHEETPEGALNAERLLTTAGSSPTNG